MKLIWKFAASATPFVCVGALLYAALCIKPQAVGASVTPPAVARGDFIYGVAWMGANALLAAGSEGKVWRGGLDMSSWTLVPTPTKSSLQDIAGWDDRHAVAVGNDGVAIITADGGRSWRAVAVPKSQVANKLVRVRTAGEREAWAVGEMGAVLHSNDFGAAWQRKAPEEDAAWNDVRPHGSKVWLVGEFGRIAYTDDGGERWHKVPAPVKSSLMGIAFRDDANGLAVGVEGVMLATKDGGATWETLAKATREHLFDLAWDGSSWLVAGDKGVLLKGAADGAQWQVMRASDNDRGWHTKVASTATHYLIAGENFASIRR